MRMARWLRALTVSAPMTSSVTFDFTPSDYRKALLSIALQRSRKVIAAIAFCTVTVTTLSVYRVWLNGMEGTSFSGAYLLLFVIAFYGFIVFGLPLLQSRDKLNQNIFQATTISCEEDRFVVQLENGYSETVPYEHIVKTTHNPHYAFYWKNSVDAVILPQHAFPSIDAYREQVHAINDKLKS